MSVELLKHASPVLLRTSASSNNLFYNSDSDLCSIITNKNKNTNDVVKANGEIKEKNNKFLDVSSSICCWAIRFSKFYNNYN